MKEKTVVKLWAATLIALLEAVNLSTTNVDGAIFSAVIGTIAGLAGYEMGRGRKK